MAHAPAGWESCITLGPKHQSKVAGVTKHFGPGPGLHENQRSLK